MTALNFILIALAIFLFIVIRCISSSLRQSRKETTDYRSLYSDAFRQICLITSWSANPSRIYFLKEITHGSFGVFMRVSLPSLDDSFCDGTRHIDILLKRITSTDPEFSKLLAEELLEKLTE